MVSILFYDMILSCNTHTAVHDPSKGNSLCVMYNFYFQVLFKALDR